MTFLIFSLFPPVWLPVVLPRCFVPVWIPSCCPVPAGSKSSSHKKCIKWIIFYCFCISCFKHWTFHDYSILYTEMWQIYPTFRCVKWNNHEKSSIWNTKYRNTRRFSILYAEMWGKHIWKTFHFIQGEFHKHLCCL